MQLGLVHRMFSNPKKTHGYCLSFYCSCFVLYLFNRLLRLLLREPSALLLRARLPTLLLLQMLQTRIVERLLAVLVSYLVQHHRCSEILFCVTPTRCPLLRWPRVRVRRHPFDALQHIVAFLVGVLRRAAPFGAVSHPALFERSKCQKRAQLGLDFFVPVLPLALLLVLPLVRVQRIFFAKTRPRITLRRSP